MIRNYAGRNVTVDAHGYLTDPGDWDIEIGKAIAAEEGLVLNDMHLLVIDFLRTRYFSGRKLSIRDINSSGVTTLKEFYSLFPGTPLKKACRIGGLPYPESCV